MLPSEDASQSPDYEKILKYAVELFRQPGITRPELDTVVAQVSQRSMIGCTIRTDNVAFLDGQFLFSFSQTFTSRHHGWNGPEEITRQFFEFETSVYEWGGQGQPRR